MDDSQANNDYLAELLKSHAEVTKKASRSRALKASERSRGIHL